MSSDRLMVWDSKCSINKFTGDVGEPIAAPISVSFQFYLFVHDSIRKWNNLADYIVQSPNLKVSLEFYVVVCV